MYCLAAGVACAYGCSGIYEAFEVPYSWGADFIHSCGAVESFRARPNQAAVRGLHTAGEVILSCRGCGWTALLEAADTPGTVPPAAASPAGAVGPTPGGIPIAGEPLYLRACSRSVSELVQEWLARRAASPEWGSGSLSSLPSGSLGSGELSLPVASSPSSPPSVGALSDLPPFSGTLSWASPPPDSGPLAAGPRGRSATI